MGAFLVGKQKKGNPNTQRNNHTKAKNGFPKIATFAQMEQARMEERKFKK